MAGLHQATTVKQVFLTSFSTVLSVLTELVSTEAVAVKGIVGGSVLLNCSCNNRVQNKDLSWQLGDTIAVFKESSLSSSEVGEKFTGRVKLSSSKDCSLFISDISVADHGTYMCSFYIPSYTYEKVDLIVSASYHVCMKQVSEETLEVSRQGPKMFQCQASGGYPESKIQWFLNDKPLHNCSRTDRIIKDDFTGLFDLSSNLTIELNGGVDGKITCGIETPGLSSRSSCSTSFQEQQKSAPTVPVSVAAPVCVIVLLLVVLALVVWQYQRRKMRRHSAIKKTSDPEDPMGAFLPGTPGDPGL